MGLETLAPGRKCFILEDGIAQGLMIFAYPISNEIQHHIVQWSSINIYVVQ